MGVLSAPWQFREGLDPVLADELESQTNGHSMGINGCQWASLGIMDPSMVSLR